MARPKLSRDQRRELRQELRERLRNGAAIADIVNDLSKKYKVAGETIRWYLKRDGITARKWRDANRQSLDDGRIILLEGKQAEVVVMIDNKPVSVALVVYSSEERLVRGLRRAVEDLAVG